MNTWGRQRWKYRRPSLFALALAAVLAVPSTAMGAATLIAEWGTSGSGPGQFSLPDDMAISASGDVYVADANNHRIQQFTSTGTFIREFGGFGVGAGQLNSPNGIDLDSAGNVYVSDRGNHRVAKFSPTGVFERAWGKNVIPGGPTDFEVCTTTCMDGFPDATAGSLNAPEGLAIDSADNIYVSEFFGPQRVQVFRPDGTLTGVSWGSVGTGDGQFNRPVALAASGNEIYVADRDNHRVQRFDSAGNFLSSIGTPGAADGQLSGPTGMAVDPSGNVWVSDNNNYRMQQFTPAGVFLSNFGTFAPGTQAFRPGSVEIEPGGDLYVIDGQANFSRVLRLRVTPDTPVQGESVNVSVVSGTVEVDIPGDSEGFVPLEATDQIPVGSKVDTTQGRVALTSATKGGGTQTAEFYDGSFKVGQGSGSDQTTMRLLGNPSCGGAKGDRKTPARKRKPRLWGSGSGNFSSTGDHGSASVRGTVWQLFEACGGVTGTSVKQGKVRFRNFYTDRTVTVKAGQTVLAKPPRKR